MVKQLVCVVRCVYWSGDGDGDDGQVVEKVRSTVVGICFDNSCHSLLAFAISSVATLSKSSFKLSQGLVWFRAESVIILGSYESTEKVCVCKTDYQKEISA